MFESIEANAGWDLVERYDAFNGANVETLESVGSETLAHESTKLNQALFQRVNGVACGSEDLRVVPDLCVKLFKGSN